MDYQKNTKENTVFRIKLLVLVKVLRSAVLYYITQPLYLRACVLSCNQQQVQQYILERHDNIIYKLFFRSKKTIKVILSSITKIKLIACIEDPEEVFSMDYVYIEDTKVKETTVVDITTTSHSVGSNTIFIINLDAG